MSKSKGVRKPAIPICHDCDAEEGQLHQLGCDMERCPFCGGQLICCDCCYDKLGLRDLDKYDDTTYFLPKEIYEHGLTDEQEAKWKAMLNEKGRVPYIVYPNICAKCGALWPGLFMVPDSEWELYIQPGMRDKVICRPCYDYIQHIIDTAVTIHGG